MQDGFHESPLYPFLVSQIRTPAIHFIIYGQLTKTLLRLTQKAQNRQMGSGQGVDYRGKFERQGYFRDSDFLN
jgi:hypothetical protein